MPLEDRLSGDEVYYVGKARSLYRHGSYAVNERPISAERTLSYSDFRPPGYAMFVSAFLPFGETNMDLRRCIRLSQFLLDVASTTLLLGVAFQFNRAKGFHIASAVLLGIQPWTSAYIASIYPDTLAAFLATTGILGLSMFVGAGKWYARVPALFSGSALLSLAFGIRPEMIVFVPAMVLISLILVKRKTSWRAIASYGILSALPFLTLVGMNIAYRWHVERQFRIFGEFRHVTPGLIRWTQTWIGLQTSKEELLFGGLTRGGMDVERFARLPKRAFADAAEWKALENVVRNAHSRGYMTVEEDDVFMEIARARIAADPLTYFLWTRLYNSFYLWINMSNAAHYLSGFALVPRVFSKSLTALFFFAKIAVLLGFMGGACALALRLPLAMHVWHANFVLLGAFFAVMRTFIVGFYVDLAEFRYALVAWPCVLIVALFGLAHVWPCRRIEIDCRKRKRGGVADGVRP
ncbi:MAG: hypothetical protein AB7V14_06980 [Kiritimatiellia bacterium]